MLRNFSMFHLFALCAVLGAGCGGSIPDGRKAIKGTVSLNGSPVEQGTIQFEPHGAESRLGTGAIIEKGEFSIPAEKGLPAGTYRVMIFAGEGGHQEDAAMPGETGPVGKELIPAEYNVNSNVTVDVKDEGENEFPFDIKSS